MLAVSATVYALLLLEWCLYAFCVQTNGNHYTLQTRRWFAKHWHPVNSLGYRDIEHDQANIAGRHVVFVVGDSFAAGYGIKRSSDRFSDVVQATLGNSYRVVNIAKPGWDTADEYQAIRTHPLAPTTIVLSYFINDIGTVAANRGHIFVEPPTITNHLARSIIDHSHVANAVYWTLYDTVNSDIEHNYLDYLARSYNDRDIWDAHMQELATIINYSQERKAQLLVVLFPDVRNLPRTRRFTAQVADFFSDNHVTAIDLAAHLSDIDPQKLVVNSRDGHPNEAVHRLVAELLVEAILNSDNRCSEPKQRPENSKIQDAMQLESFLPGTGGRSRDESVFRVRRTSQIGPTLLVDELVPMRQLAWRSFI